MFKKDALLNFIERLNTYQIVLKQPFLTLYPDWFSEVFINLENEIHENMSFAQINKENYLNYVKRRISEEIPFENNEETIEKWKETYNLEDLIFPYLDNQEIKIRIASSLDAEYLNQNEKQRCKEIQIDFYCHYAMIKKHEMIHFIDNLTSNSIISYKEEDWFKFGVLLASGRLKKYYVVKKNGAIEIKEGFSARKIAKELDMPNNMVSATFSGYSTDNKNSNKNIFNDSSKISKIKEHCDKNSIAIVSEFLNRIPKE